MVGPIARVVICLVLGWGVALHSEKTQDCDAINPICERSDACFALDLGGDWEFKGVYTGEYFGLVVDDMIAYFFGRFEKLPRRGLNLITITIPMCT
eukprot:1367503-Amorphochlora_amoeboformis.AAC.1